MQKRELLPASSIINSEYSGKKYPGTRVLLINGDKKSRSSCNSDILHELERYGLDYPRIVVILDENVDISDVKLVSWVSLNKFDPLEMQHYSSFGDDQILYSMLVLKQRE